MNGDGALAAGCLLLLTASCAASSAERPSRPSTAEVTSASGAAGAPAAPPPPPAWLQHVDAVCLDAVTIVNESSTSVDVPNAEFVTAALQRVLGISLISVEKPPCSARVTGALSMKVTFSQFTAYASYVGVPQKLSLMHTWDHTCSFPLVGLELTMTAPGEQSFSYVVRPEAREPKRAARCETNVSHKGTWQRPVLAALAEVWGDRPIAAATIDRLDGGGGLDGAVDVLRDGKPFPQEVAEPIVLGGLKSDRLLTIEAAAVWAAELPAPSSAVCAALVASLREHAAQRIPGESLFKAAEAQKCLERDETRDQLVGIAARLFDGVPKSRDECGLLECPVWTQAARLLARAKSKEGLRPLARVAGFVFPRAPTPVLLEAIGKIGITPDVAGQLAPALARKSWSEREVVLVRGWGPVAASILCNAIGSDDPDARSQARAAIVETGVAARPCLEKAAKHRKAEIRTWARAALGALP